MLHVELHRFPHSARAFNLGEDDVRATIVDPWEAGRLIELGERFWEPGECRLTILEGPALAPNELSMGRGWPTARKRGRDVTAELIRPRAAADPGAPAPGPPFAEFKDEVLGLGLRRPTPLPELWRLAGLRYPERALSERLGLAERAVGELLHDGLATLATGERGGGATAGVPASEVERVLLAWESWVDRGAAPVLLEATGRGARRHGRSSV